MIYHCGSMVVAHLQNFTQFWVIFHKLKKNKNPPHTRPGKLYVVWMEDFAVELFFSSFLRRVEFVPWKLVRIKYRSKQWSQIIALNFSLPTSYLVCHFYLFSIVMTLHYFEHFLPSTYCMGAYDLSRRMLCALYIIWLAHIHKNQLTSACS